MATNAKARQIHTSPATTCADMKEYIYAADCYCEACGEDIRRRLIQEGKAPKDPADEWSYDSDEFPKGPYEIGEVDLPEHCGSGPDCLNAYVLQDGTKIGCWMENDLTEAGILYVREYMRDDPDNEVTQLWATWYRQLGYYLDRDPEDY